MKTGTLYLIPTPIDNRELKDILLKEDIEKVVKLKNFVVETPKNARRNLGSLEMETPMREINMMELSEHTKNNGLQELLKPLYAGEDIGLMSDAGSPSIADPGFRLVIEAQNSDILVVPFVGPSSIILALMGSGLNGQSFAFNGYIPKDVEELRKRIRLFESLALKLGQTQIYMDTPYRNQKLYEHTVSVCNPNTYLCIALNVGGEDGYIKTMSIADWRKNDIQLPKQPCLFLINRI